MKIKKFKIVKGTDKKIGFWERLFIRIIFGKFTEIKFMRTDHFNRTIYSLIVGKKIHDLLGGSEDSPETQSCWLLFTEYGVRINVNEIIFESHNNKELNNTIINHANKVQGLQVI